MHKAYCLILAFMTFGCIAQPDGEGSNPIETSTSDDEVFTDTIVDLHPDGTSSVQIRAITGAERAAQAAAREARLQARASAGSDELGESQQAIVADNSCDNAALWVYDKVNLDGRRICFRGAGTAHLETYCRLNTFTCTVSGCKWVCVDKWSESVKSYWPGESGGYLYYHHGDIDASETFQAWGPATNAGYWGVVANEIVLYAP